MRRTELRRADAVKQGVTAIFEPNPDMFDALADTPDEAEALYLLAEARMRSQTVETP